MTCKEYEKRVIELMCRGYTSLQATCIVFREWLEAQPPEQDDE